VSPLLAAVGLALATFVSTSFDNFTLLLGFFADDEYPRRQVVGGYLVSVVTVVLLAWAGSAAVEMAPTSYLGYLGLIPLGLGVVGLFRMVKGAEKAVARPSAVKGFTPVFLVMLANSGDSLAVFVSVFGDTAESLEIPMLLTAAFAAIVYASLARWLVTRSAIGAHIQRGARVVLPFLLIAIGSYILMNTGTDVVP